MTLKFVDMTGLSRSQKDRPCCAFYDDWESLFLVNNDGFPIFIDLFEVSSHPRADEMLPLIPRSFVGDANWIHPDEQPASPTRLERIARAADELQAAINEWKEANAQ